MARSGRPAHWSPEPSEESGRPRSVAATGTAGAAGAPGAPAAPAPNTARRSRRRPEVREPAPRDPVARVVVDVPLAHLDRPFDYLVPAALDDAVVPGSRVRVRFAGQLVDALVLQRAAASDHGGRLAYVERSTSAEPVLSPDVAVFARAVADRWAGSLIDVLRLALPPRHARVEAEPPRRPADRSAAPAGVPDSGIAARPVGRPIAGEPPAGDRVAGSAAGPAGGEIVAGPGDADRVAGSAAGPAGGEIVAGSGDADRVAGSAAGPAGGQIVAGPGDADRVAGPVGDRGLGPPAVEAGDWAR